jgi:hypothetical protein
MSYARAIAVAIGISSFVYYLRRLTLEGNPFRDIEPQLRLEFDTHSLLDCFNTINDDSFVKLTSTSTVGNWFGSWYMVTVELQCSHSQLAKFSTRNPRPGKLGATATFSFSEIKESFDKIKVFGWYGGWFFRSFINANEFPSMWYRKGEVNENDKEWESEDTIRE